jgi:hypothetical protein
MQGQISLRDSMAVCKKGRQPSLNRPPGCHVSQITEGQGVLHPVFQEAFSIYRLKTVKVLPARERPFKLFIRELAAWNPVSVLCHPFQFQRTQAHANLFAAAGSNASTL